ncbi:hypothetical protein ACFY0R_16410 [Streptomyces sp. NPDC001633]|uniref:hypothetical protein n=1 Tax=Streptomyces sp. NPDC001633 TaxID=3364595 RepID=UPI0036BB773B
MQTEEMRRFEEFDAAFPDYHAEMVDGEVYLSTVVTSPHGNMLLALASQLVGEWSVMTRVDTVHEGWHGKTLVKKYAQAGIPYYLIVNPIEGKCLLYSLPEGEHYRASLETDFGKPVPLGEPFDLALDTTALYTY